jgi:enterochelin esterase family protein
MNRRLLLSVPVALLAVSVPGRSDNPAPAQPQPKKYTLGPDSLPQDGVPRGKLEGPFPFQSKILANTTRMYFVYVPAQYDPAKPAAVLVFQDGQRACNPNGVIRVQNVLDNLIHKKEMPVTIGIFITPGQRGEEYPTSLGFGNPNNRSVEYDSLGDAYARFVCEEMLPEVGKNITSRRTRTAGPSAASAAAPSRRSPWRGSGQTNSAR